MFDRLRNAWARIKTRAHGAMHEASTYCGGSVLSAIGDKLQLFGQNNQTLLWIAALCAVVAIFMREGGKHPADDTSN